MLEDISSEYVSFSVHAIGYLSRAVLRDLDEAVFKQLFTAAWENAYGDSLASVIVATLQVPSCSPWAAPSLYPHRRGRR